MIFACEKNKLTEAISVVQKAVSSKSTLVVLEGILLEAKGNTLTLSSNNLDLSMTYTMEANIEEEGNIVLPARIFGDIVRKMAANNLHFSVAENHVVTVKGGNAVFEIMGLAADEFPQSQVVNKDKYLVLTEELFKNMISSTIFCTAVVDLKPILTGVLFDFKEDSLNLVAVDGYRLAKRTLKVENSNITAQFVIPGKTLSEIYKVLSDSDKKVTLYVDERNILFEFEKFTVVSRLLEGEFLNYDAIIPTEHRLTAIVNTADFIAAIERTSLIVSSEGTKTPLRLNIKEGEFDLSCTSQMGRVSDSVGAQINGDDMEIGFNYRYLLDALRASGDEEVKMEFNMSLNPCLIKPLEGEDYLYMVLPIRLS